MTGTVKGLDWVERVGVTGTFDAETSIGHFIATVNDDNQAFWFILGLTRSNYVGGPDVEAAKAAAQADYERRVLSALTASASEPATEEDDDGERLRDAWSDFEDENNLVYEGHPLYMKWRACHDAFHAAWPQGNAAAKAAALAVLSPSPLPASAPEPVADQEELIADTAQQIISDIEACACEDCATTTQRHIRNLAAILTASTNETSGAKTLHGPFGWLNGVRGLSEDTWELERTATSISQFLSMR